MTRKQAIPIFVISLASVPERRKSIEKHLQQLGLQYEIVDAVDGRMLPDEQIRTLLAPGVSYLPGVVGCYLSHTNLYKRIVDNGISVALILEDDARLNPKFIPAIKHGLDFLGFEYCLLDCDEVSEGNPVFYDAGSKQWLTKGFPVYQTNIGPALLHAYLITERGAKRRIQYDLPIHKPVDVYAHLPYRPDIYVCVFPKGASVSDHSRISFTSLRHETAPLKFKFLRRFDWLFILKDWFKLRPIFGRLRAARLLSEGKLEPGRRWRPMPSGRNIMG